ncbi:IclR family transcriptional regulator C-terminal domain-containing protein [Streptomyces sp. NBC_01565]|uniref:IclR family transcriptional regulator n=1 Tax=Streptomyces sp. NBC_01565 TaxID=2975881 RepID=UPI002B1CC3CF|nr:IclR family transcriptional regulator C-terminal domain-containing protein [Streptomyces sp. NBC_01565]
MDFDGMGWGIGRAAITDGLEVLLAGSRGSADAWDRPEGDWGEGLSGLAEEEAAARREANSCYRLGSKALLRGDLELAELWLRSAYAQDHPGAAFRLAVAVHRRGTRQEQGGHAEAQAAIVSLLSQAALWGHSGARRALGRSGPGKTAEGEGDAGVDDADLASELAAALHEGTAPAAVPLSGPGPVADTALAAGARPVSPRLRGGGRPRVAAAGGGGELAAPPGAQDATWGLRVLEVLSRRSGGASLRRIAQDARLPVPVVRQTLVWLGRQGLAKRLAGGGFAEGPLLPALQSTNPAMAKRSLRHTLALLRDAVGAAVYISSYEDGEVRIAEAADGPGMPKVVEWVDFRSAAHASAVGKCLLALLGPDGRRDHMSRHKFARLTSRTIVTEKILFSRLERHRLSDPVLDVQEYSPGTVCAAVPVSFGTTTACVALSMPLSQASRLNEAAAILASQAGTVLLTLMLAGGIAPAREVGPEPPSQAPCPMPGAERRFAMADRLLLPSSVSEPRLRAPNRMAEMPSVYWARDTLSKELYVFDFALVPEPGEQDAGPALVLPQPGGEVVTDADQFAPAPAEDLLTSCEEQRVLVYAS